MASLAYLRWLHLGKKEACFIGTTNVLAFAISAYEHYGLFPGVDGCRVDACSVSVHRVVAYPLPLFKAVGPPVRHTKTANAELVGSLQCFLSKDDAIKVHSCNSSLLKPFENGLIKLQVLLNPGLLASVVEGLSFSSFFDFTPFQDNGIQCRR